MKNRKESSVLVTGAAGLQGYHLVRDLVQQQNVGQVVGVDDLSRGFEEDPWEWVSNLHKKFIFEERRYQSLSTQDLKEFDSIIHLAASISVPESMESEDMQRHYWKNNATDNLEFMIKLMKIPKSKWPVLVYASTSEIFGDPKITPMPPDHTQKTHSIYAASKLAAESQINAYANWFNYPAVVVRTFNTYGPNQNSFFSDAAVIAKFITQALAGEPLIIHGDGTQTRDFQYVGDAIRAYRLLALNGLEDGSEYYAFREKQYNTGTGKQKSIRDLADLIISLTESDSGIRYGTARTGDIVALEADYSLIKKEVGWEPVMGLEQGLMPTIDWYKKQYIKKGIIKAELSEKPRKVV